MAELQWRCEDCGWRGNQTQLLRAPNPFDPECEIVGCPQCKSVNGFENMCDEPGCKELATCGWPSNAGYRRTCHAHYQRG